MTKGIRGAITVEANTEAAIKSATVELLNEMIAQNNLTQEKLAEILDVSPNYIGRIERGQHNPSLEKIAKIANVLNVKAFELFIERND